MEEVGLVWRKGGFLCEGSRKNRNSPVGIVGAQGPSSGKKGVCLVSHSVVTVLKFLLVFE